MAVFLIAPICSMGISYISLKNLSISVETEVTSTARGEMVDLHFLLRNKMPFPMIQLKIILKEENRFAHQTEPDRERHIILFPGQGWIFSHNPDTSICGIVKVTLSSFALSDYFGLITLERKIPSIQQLQVFPKIRTRTIPDIIPFQGRKTEDFSQVRDYVAGDPLNLIHWKLTAKKGAFMVKESSNTAEQTLILGVELYDNEEHIINKILDHSYSLTRSCIVSGQFLTLTWWNISEQEQEFRTPTTMDELQDCFSSLLCAETYTHPYLLSNAATLPTILVNENGAYEFDERINF